ncbi:MAG: Flagellar biosynthetic protein FlhB [Alphaproteobacteria bacterium MarineAlpha3_Bin5]|nr:flagellar biosynthesis protein FlhB [Magnetovibrio sp.]PPR80079.1 MAG: Flagellar biosynthetic protein FlhB [Alphaproteobacteria bacterium MarineAlpha3_Bin5]|tara:strand:- start:217 stop:1287 length:1071 start_codon:yes stop_codon:yes gene_type:complete
MAEEDDAQKTEEPSERKLGRARDKGQVAQSQEVKNWFILFGGGIGLFFMAPMIANNLRQIVFPYIEQPHAMPADFDQLRLILAETILSVGINLSPLFLLLLLLAIASNVIQFGLLMTAEKMKPELKKLSLITGLKRMFSSRSLVEFGKGIAKLILVTTVAMGLTIPFIQDITLFPAIHITESLDRIQLISIQLAAGTLAVMTAIAGLDWMYQKYAFTKQMRMSKQEVKDEHKQSEGDPQVKARIRQLRTQRAQQRMMARVPDADVVITNPTHYAVALEYKMGEMPAPILVAKGLDVIAMRIREVAEENEIPIVENPPLARALYSAVELDEEIPPEHFAAVAEVISYVMRLKGKLPN